MPLVVLFTLEDVHLVLGLCWYNCSDHIQMMTTCCCVSNNLLVVLQILCIPSVLNYMYLLGLHSFWLYILYVFVGFTFCLVYKIYVSVGFTNYMCLLGSHFGLTLVDTPQQPCVPDNIRRGRVVFRV